MKFTDNKFGSRLIDAISFGLYDGNVFCLREYIQNSIDNNADDIQIYFENNHKDLIIQDNGTGMDKEELEKSLDLGRSNKKGTQVGWRGIGIWSGLPLSKRLVIITKKKNNHKYRIEIDSNKLKEQLSGDRSATELLSESTGEIEKIDLGKDESFENSSFTTVRFESLYEEKRKMFTKENITEYLASTVPANFDEDKFHFSETINSLLKEKGIILPNINITIEGEKLFRPPYNDDIFFDKVFTKEFKVNKKSIAFGWFLSFKENEENDEPNNGIYFKKKGFTIGDKYKVINQFPGTFNEWYYGEIHVFDELKENTARNNFEDSPYREKFYADIKDYINTLQLVNRYKSKKLIDKSISKIDSYIEKGDVNLARKEIEKARTRLLTSAKYPDEPSLKYLKSVIDVKSEKHLKYLEELESKLKTCDPKFLIERKKELLNSVLDNLPTPLIQYASKLTPTGIMEPELNVMEEIRKLLANKTNLDIADKSLDNLSKHAFGWNGITPMNKPLLTLSENKNLYADRLFGVMIEAMNQIFVNSFKHKEEKKASWKWFEKLDEKERIDVLIGMYSTVGLIYALIENSEKNPDPLK